MPTSSDTHTKISALLEEWEVLSLAESEAIASEQWHQLRTHQSVKERLMTRLDEAIRASGYSRDRLARIFAAPFNTLSHLERLNAQTLETAMTSIREQINRLDVSDRSLHKLRRSYGVSETHEAWSNYS